ncbi:MAG: diguanylate cyclase [Mariprofundaceae bacterium]|nr:diguanylate cyclase [Mariprofundaceae bacterium]
MIQPLLHDVHGTMHVLMVMPNMASPLLCLEMMVLKEKLLSLPTVQCYVCTDAKHAVALALACNPTIIFQDMHMQGAHGLDILRSYQQHSFLKKIPVVMVDMRNHTWLRRYAFGAGAWDCISQAMSYQECLAKIQYAHRYVSLQQQNEHLSQILRENERHLQQCETQLQHATSLDGLTGLPNRHHFMATYEREWRRALRETDALSLLLIDIDYFKVYNDTYGYQEGDQCLRKVGCMIPDLLQRSTDFCGRYAGAAFVILLPMTPAKGAIQVAERIRNAVHGLQIPHQKSPVSDCVTVSVGLVTTCPMLKHQTRDMVRKVERACFDAKQQGCDCLVCKSL